MHPVAQQFNQLRAELSAFFKEREEMIYANVLAILAKQHAYTLGGPGTAKSDIIVVILAAMRNARHFEALLSKNRPAEAVLGPVDLEAYRLRNEYKLKRTGFASDVEFMFLDEVGKMSPVLGHDLLALVNERKYHEVNGGRSSHPAPLWTMLTASNEMITTESDDAAALWDRLVVRVVVDDIKDRANFIHVLTAPRPDFTTTVDFADLQQAYDDVISQIEISDEALMAIVMLRERLAKEHIYPSPRRFRQAMGVLRAAAFLDGRDTVEEQDVAVLRFVLWETVEHIEKVHRMCLSISNPFYEELMNVQTGLQELALSITERVGESEGNRTAHGKSVNTKLKAAREQLDVLMRQSPARPIPGFKEVADLHATISLDNLVRMMGQDEDVAEIANRKRVGLGDGTEYWKKD